MQTGVIEVIYSIVIMIISLLIYYRTKELYKLSQHQGIKYFRLTFLFFGLSYGFKLFINYFKLTIGNNFPMHMFPYNLSLIITYTTSMAFLSLIYSLVWKKYKLKDNIFVLHTIALIITLSSIMQKGREGILCFALIQIIFFIIALIISITHLIKQRKKHKKTKLNIHIIYLLFLVSWIFNILATILSITVSILTGTIIYSISFVLLLIILIRIYNLTK